MHPCHRNLQECQDMILTSIKQAYWLEKTRSEFETASVQDWIYLIHSMV